ncbi:MAG TPA: bifunctional [glutamine synthetase] adenylyltransferase/[glutamine synthetase]-adenylyl-L-tyrosine phosphorylase [Micropepsaceae bacterium]|nr:bifunctional [glutamine synthetase] adenylyltransferase/[glutamine synthetase]-adenylyl-L-tyrosine phosphorylase [Micropepsaceae bacterium]
MPFGPKPAIPPIFDPARATRTLEALQSLAPSLASRENSRSLLAAAAGNSPFLARSILKEPEFLEQLFDDDPDRQLESLVSEARSAGDEQDFAAAQARLRIAKQRASLAIALSDIAGDFDLSAGTRHLTRFADACVAGALQYELGAESRRENRAHPVVAEDCGLIVLAMGKMGAFELNYSSDIDLIVFFDESRFPFTRGGDRQQAAVAIVKGMVRQLSEATANGYVFRCDLRLRPDAGATQVAISTAAAEGYYEAMGQNWERAAWIKARQCAGDRHSGEGLLRRMEPFVWRKHLDYAAISDIHSIKRQIHSHGGHSRIAVAGHNIKLGRGGIREIEFFVQTQQLILGGRDSGLRMPATLEALAALNARGHISRGAQRDLSQAYVFLRMVEHRLQMIEDQQTHLLPKSPDGLDHVARFAGFDDTNKFEETLRGHLENVQKHYAQLFESEEPLSDRTGNLVFTGVEEDPETVATLSGMGFANAPAISAVIRGWHHGRIRATRSERARELLTKLMPSLLKSLSQTADPHSAFMHFDRFLGGLPAGVQLFSMLLANRRLLDLLAEIAGSAPRLSDYLGRNPGVLDALTDPEFLSRSPSSDQLGENFAKAVAGHKYESALDAARRFAKEEMFRVGARLIFGSAPARDAGPAYSAVAETVIAGLQTQVENHMAEAHGHVPAGAVAVVALGKLGGREMTATSDLDLVFIYTHDPVATMSAGAGKPLPVSSYFARYAQRFIAALTALTAEGRLFDVDMRLRPSGNQGPVAVSLDRFIAYHRENAWTWERMALTRARVVAGPDAFSAGISEAIPSLLELPAEPGQIRADARAMRQKLEAQFPARSPWDLKFAAGGLVDIEFCIQVLQLCHSDKPFVFDQNTIGAAGKLKSAGVLDASDHGALAAAALLQQELTQVLRVATEGEFLPATASVGLRALLARVAGVPDFAELELLLHRRQAAARAVFERVMST